MRQEELICEQSEQEGGFDLYKDKEMPAALGEASGGENVTVCIGAPVEDAKEYRMVAFCGWEQVLFEGEASAIVYPAAGQTIYDEMELPKPDMDTVYQAFLFEIGKGHTWRVMTPSFRIDLRK